MQSGYIGKIKSIRAAAYWVTSCRASAHPRFHCSHDFNYDMWLHCPARPYNKQRGIYHFRWFWDYPADIPTRRTKSISCSGHERQRTGTPLLPLAGASVQEAGETPGLQDVFHPGFTTPIPSESSAGAAPVRARVLRHERQPARQPLASRSPDMKANPANSIPVSGQPAGGPERSTVKLSPGWPPS